MPSIRSACIFFLFFYFSLSSSAKADWINLSGAENAPTIAEIYILDNHVRLVLEIYIGDIPTFEDLFPDAFLKETVNRPSLAERLKRFSSETFRFLTPDGMPLQAELQVIEPRLRIDRTGPFRFMRSPLTGRLVNQPPDDKRVVYAELVYPFKGRPDELTIIPPQTPQGLAAANIGFIAYHKAVPIIDFRYLSSSAKLFLNWDDPWYSRFNNPNLKRHHKSGIMSFLYVEPYEVRHEVLIRVRDLEEWLDLGLRGKEFIEIDELEPLKKKIGEFFLNRNRVLVDGKALRPILDRTNFVKVGLTGIQLLETLERLELSTAIVGVIIAYITGGLPKEVTVHWELFNDKIQQVPVTITDPAGPFLSFVTPEDNVLKWTNFLKKYKIPEVKELVVSQRTGGFPLGSAICFAGLVPLAWHIRTRRKKGHPIRFHAGIGSLLVAGGIIMLPYFQFSFVPPQTALLKMEQKEATNVLRGLLKNIYRAFDYRMEEDIYDKLAISVTGNLLADIYLQNRKSLAIQKAGGAQARIKNVEILNVSMNHSPDLPMSLSFNCKWTAFGTVGHWGHVHARKNQYEADITIQPIEGAWKIVGLELVEEKRIDPYSDPGNSKSSGKS